MLSWESLAYLAISAQSISNSYFNFNTIRSFTGSCSTACSTRATSSRRMKFFSMLALEATSPNASRETQYF